MTAKLSASQQAAPHSCSLGDFGRFGAMAKLSALSAAFIGRWRIVEMDKWDEEFLDLVETAHITFEPDGGELRSPSVP